MTVGSTGSAASVRTSQPDHRPTAGVGPAVAERGSTLETVLVLLVIGAVLSAIQSWIVGNGFVDERDLRLAAHIIATLGSRDYAAANLAVVYPHLPYWLGLVLALMSGVTGLAAANLLASLTGTAVVGACWIALRRAGWGVIATAFAVTVLAFHPFTLWALTSSSEQALLVAAFGAVSWAAFRAPESPAVRAAVLVGMSAVILFYSHHSAMFLVLAVLPILLAALPAAIALRSPVAAMVLALGPVIVAGAGVSIYLFWVFEDAPLALFRPLNPAISESGLVISAIPWLEGYSGTLIPPFAVATGMALMVFAPVVLGAMVAGRGRFLPPALVLAAALATGFATFCLELSHPVVMLSALTAAMVVVLVRIRAPVIRVLAVALLLAGHWPGWIAFTVWESEAESRWRSALLGETVLEATQPQRALAAYLAEPATGRRNSGLETLIDSASGYQVIASRSDLGNLRLPGDPVFDFQALTGVLTSQRVAVPDPGTDAGALDLLNQNFPDLYHDGSPGYVRAYDRFGWRVYVAVQ